MTRQLYAMTLLVAFAAACGSDAAITTPEDRATPGPLLAIGTDPVSGATIETDLDDYMPGEVVHLTGRGWAAGETVRLLMTEDPDTHEDVTMDVVADSVGGFSVHFYDVQQHDLGVLFTLTATGQTSGSVATAVFTDGRTISAVSLDNGTVTTVAPEASISANVVGALTGNSNNTLGSIGVKAYVDGTLPTTATALACYDVNPNQGPSVPPAQIPFDHTFAFDAPLAPNTYDVIVTSYSDDACAAAAGSFAFVMQNAIVVSAANGAPVVDAGGPYSGAEGSVIALSGATASDPDAGDVLTYAWTVNTTGIDAGGSCSFSPSNTVLNPSVACTDDSQGAQDGEFTLTLEVNDGQGHIVTKNADLTVTNANPTANAGEEPYSGTEGAAISLSGSGDDPGNNDDAGLTYEWSVAATGIDAGGACNLSSTTAQNPTVTCTDDGNFTVSLVVRDDDGGVSTGSTVNLTVGNANPTAGAGGPYTGIEGSAVSLTGTKSDGGSNDTHTYAWTWAVQSGVDAGASCSFSDATALSPNVTCTDDGVFKLTLTVTDDDGGTGNADATLTLGNANPSVTLVSPTDGTLFSLLNGAIAVSATYSDAGSNDTHMCRFELDGALDVIGSYAAVSGGTCAGSILPQEAGVYTLTVRVKDDDDGVGTASVMVVVYDPSAGFVTGGGWIQSDPGAYKPNAGLSGKATFGFVSKYKKGATTPEGNTEFQFHAGGMSFQSSQYQWLVVNQGGTNAQFKGTGTINGLGSYTFMLWATDAPTGDRFRMQITDDNNGGATVYDNGTEQVIASGSIVIHTGGKK